MIKVGVIGLGMMGNSHLDVYSHRSDVEVVAVSDSDPARLSGEEKAAGNIEGQAAGSFDLHSVMRFDEGMDLINFEDIDLVDICLPTPLHYDYACAGLKCGKHVLLEKPLARTADKAFALAQLSQTSSGFLMPAMCIRFWPGWSWLQRKIEDQEFGKVRSAHFRRVASHPGGPFYSDGQACGGAIMDLHIHDSDITQFYFGRPKSVQSFGYSCITGEIDHIFTRYEFEDIPLVTAEGSWSMVEGFPFTMQYTVNFENAAADFDLNRKDQLLLYRKGREPESVALLPGMGYEYEIDYFLDCIKRGRQPRMVTAEDGAWAVKIIEAESASIKTGHAVSIE